MDTQWHKEVLPNVIIETVEGRNIPLLFLCDFFLRSGQV